MDKDVDTSGISDKVFARDLTFPSYSNGRLQRRHSPTVTRYCREGDTLLQLCVDLVSPLDLPIDLQATNLGYARDQGSAGQAIDSKGGLA